VVVVMAVKPMRRRVNQETLERGVVEVLAELLEILLLLAAAALE
jgi:hypothetical protein